MSAILNCVQICLKNVFILVYVCKKLNLWGVMGFKLQIMGVAKTRTNGLTEKYSLSTYDHTVKYVCPEPRNGSREHDQSYKTLYNTH